MSEILSQIIRHEVKEYYKRRPVGSLDFDGQEEYALGFIRRLDKDNLTRDENPYNHFCVYFAAYDPDSKEVFIGLHKKSGLWLFNGGHIDQGETPQQTLRREMEEEWGVEMSVKKTGNSSLLTITDIEDSANIDCMLHYDIWYFVPVEKSSFNPDNDKLSEEFIEMGWKTIREARELITDPNTLLAIDNIE